MTQQGPNATTADSSLLRPFEGKDINLRQLCVFIEGNVDEDGNPKGLMATEVSIFSLGMFVEPKGIDE
ncbi:MAG: hypothetical protein VX724_00690 [Chloroflexota bacterium]|nr:hypothetical protein [Chloroflexota bacterium]